MPKQNVLNVTQDISDIIHLFFKGDVSQISKSELKDIYNDPNKNPDFQVISKKS